MAIRIFRTVSEYVSHIQLAEDHCTRTQFASSYLPSHLFSKATVSRYFEQDIGKSGGFGTIASNIWQRRKKIHTNMRHAVYREIYEVEAFEQFCTKGIIHRQEPGFRATPKEIVDALTTLRDLLGRLPYYAVALTREVLPFVFMVKEGSGLTIDVRNNFGYQRIQGMLIDDAGICAEFESEFNRLWAEAPGADDRQHLVSVIDKRIADMSDSGILFGDRW